jgi:hypothetical protein
MMYSQFCNVFLKNHSKSCWNKNCWHRRKKTMPLYTLNNQNKAHLSPLLLSNCGYHIALHSSLWMQFWTILTPFLLPIWVRYKWFSPSIITQSNCNHVAFHHLLWDWWCLLDVTRIVCHVVFQWAQSSLLQRKVVRTRYLELIECTFWDLCDEHKGSKCCLYSYQNRSLQNDLWVDITQLSIICIMTLIQGTNFLPLLPDTIWNSMLVYNHYLSLL